MGRGKHFNHKAQGLAGRQEAGAGELSPKQKDHDVYDIEPVASEGDRPVSIKHESDLK
ncbi:hypothetical protein LRR81_04135 [Metabacillus sp. GX 13764]|uniref:hypothetical protein n=1 Tax=Metabacillus kandeliae TaxID=2900151 RepID=UPI001E41E7A1|nr:hypothetical protein [Metabacillus kandeliae]MCD7033409.1 hypothetical protein [Metabacillus kandeliae]